MCVCRWIIEAQEFDLLSSLITELFDLLFGVAVDKVAIVLEDVGFVARSLDIVAVGLDERGGARESDDRGQHEALHLDFSAKN